MKNIARLTPNRCVRLAAMALCTGLLSGYPVLAGDAKQITPPATEEEQPYSNWVDLTLGGLIIKGNQAQFHQSNPTLGPIFGGIDDMHLQQYLGKTFYSLDAHAIFADSDYRVKIELSQPDLGYIKAGFTEFCTYSNGNGGYLPPNLKQPNTLPDGMFFPGPEYALYRGSIWVELGLRVPNIPELTLRYEHTFRNGQEDSTSWGGADTGRVTSTNNSNVRKIVPSFRNINETRDIFTFNAKHLFGKPESFGNTEVNLGMIYEFDNTKDSLNFHNLPGAAPAAVANNYQNIPLSANDYYITQADQVSLALYSGHISSVTRFGDKLWLTAGFSYSGESTDIGGSRIAGPAYGLPYEPYRNNTWYANHSGSYIDLGGGSAVGQSIAALNLLWMPMDTLTISPSVRVECTNTRSSSTYLTQVNQVNGTAGPSVRVGNTTVRSASVTTPADTQVAASMVNSQIYLTTIAECLQLRYTGVENWVFYAQGDWDQQYESRGDQTPNGGYVNATRSNVLNLSANNSWLTQKYSLGANWYPLPTLNAAIQYYLQLQDISQVIHSDDPVMANQRLAAQSWNTSDVNFRVTWQPFPTLSIVSRYDFQRTTINSQWALDANWAVDGGPEYTAPDGQSGLITNNMITESLTWSPTDRLFFQGSLSYVLNKTASPASLQTQAIVNSNNNYWTAGAGFGFAIDPKTELRGDFSFYSANNYVNNGEYGVPYGAGATEYTFSASLIRQITKNVRVSLKYYMDNYRDVLSGGNNSYTAQMISTNLQVQF